MADRSRLKELGMVNSDPDSQMPPVQDGRFVVVDITKCRPAEEWERLSQHWGLLIHLHGGESGVAATENWIEEFNHVLDVHEVEFLPSVLVVNWAMLPDRDLRGLHAVGAIVVTDDKTIPLQTSLNRFAERVESRARRLAKSSDAHAQLHVEVSQTPISTAVDEETLKYLSEYPPGVTKNDCDDLLEAFGSE